MHDLVGKYYEQRDFDGKEWMATSFGDCRMIACSFQGARLDEWETEGCHFMNCDFRGSYFNASRHLRSSFTNCLFDSTNLFGVEWNECKLVGSDLSGAKLEGMTVIRGDWSFTNLRHANLARQSLQGVRLVEADLYEADLCNADLRNADMRRAILDKVKLQGADLRGARVDGIDFTHTDVCGVRMEYAEAILFARSYGVKVE
ncbi:pentapeptide repeat-containing protein [Mechercharimyces sp. CAU 1602]|uniref:pentapeptide repeat-containing protein n=1 Tax=Mechercharimyces sp. CAU 1602 TaxID=2973933 RepID=UPI00216257F4|nr:pentapeptide repeat-containing protein [Mechercharimyces sp. CAU 1602]MCS1351978.1 pentapeptide repeat-containing protein [Mechercharimyces sp. CAU 1602]